MYVRANQVRILIYRPVLLSATSIMENRNHAQKAVEGAKDTIRVLARLNETSDIYRSQQVCFNYFLISALAVLFLAVSHAPAEFNSQVRDEFYMALDLVKGFSTKSYISQRLWRTIRGLKELGPKLGLVSRQPFARDDEDPHSSAAVAMAGLAGHPVQEMGVYPSPQGASSIGSSPMNGQQMSYELTTLFEAAGVASSNGAPSSAAGNGGVYGGVVHAHHPQHPPQTVDSVAPSYVGGGQPQQGQPDMGGAGGEGSAQGIYGNEGEFSRIMHHLF